MNKEFERYHKKVEIPISVIIETIFNSDNHDVETLCRYAKEYGYVDLIKEDGKKLGYYKLQDDYTKQSFYTYLSKTERKQYDYENYLCDEVEKKDKEIYRLNNIIKEYGDLDNHNRYLYEENNRLNNIINELEKYLNQEIIEWQDASDLWTKAQVQEDRIVLDKLKELKGRR